MSEMDRGGFSEQFDVSRETLQRLDTYAALLKKWNPAINLVAKSTLPIMWSRHFVDSAQIFGDAPSDTGLWLDIGSGGGFPGLVVAILAAEKNPRQTTVLIESDIRKTTFLRTVIRETGISADVRSDRIENVESLEADVLSARALAPLTQLMAFAEQHLHTDGIALFQKGVTHKEELAEALKHWQFNVEEIKSVTDPDAVVLKIGGISRV